MMINLFNRLKMVHLRNWETALISIDFNQLKYVKSDMSTSTERVQCSVAFFTYLSLTEREDRTGRFWPEVMAVRTERTVQKPTEGQYRPLALRGHVTSFL